MSSFQALKMAGRRKLRRLLLSLLRPASVVQDYGLRPALGL